jgi:hypothetical protein
MTSITATAKEFFDACETGKGWEGCKTHCTADATFSAQAEPLAEVKTLAQYTDWMKGLFGPQILCHRRRAQQRHGVWRLFRHPYRPGPGPTNWQEHADGLRLRDAVHWRQD